MRILFFVVLLGVFSGCRRGSESDRIRQPVASATNLPVQVVIEPPPPPPLRLRAPTDQLVLDGAQITNVFMHTGSGRPQTGMYGFSRLASDGRPRYHEGIDIAPLRRGAKSQPLDDVRAAADGTVAYVSRYAGNSSYGVYVVMTHDAPGVGEIYTLYAHLAGVSSNAVAGRVIPAGTHLGRLGNTPGIPVARAHLHLECGLILNSRFAGWYRERQEKPDHGNWHGSNLQGLNPSDLFARRGEDGSVDLQVYLAGRPTAFVLVCRAAKPLDYFRRYPGLWRGAAFRPGLIRLEVSEEGAVLAGGNAEETTEGVLAVNIDLPGTTGRRLIRRAGSGWQLSDSGRQWLDLLCY